MIRLDADRVRAELGHVHVIGADGMLGRAFVRLLTDLGVHHAATTIRELDITNAAAVSNWAGCSPVINCAAWTNVDGAEEEEAAATAVNARAIESLLHNAIEQQALLVNFGTDYVFNGNGTRPYRTDEAREPRNAYGRSKAAGEKILETFGWTEYLHIRTSWLYAPWGNNFVRTIAKLLRERPSIKVVNDQRGRPTSAEHLARATIALMLNKARGIYHATDGGECTWFEFAQEIGRLTGAPGRVEPCTTAEFPRPAKRPAYSVLDISETERLIGPMPDWKANLADVVARLEA